jgi:hypothetical protein
MTLNIITACSRPQNLEVIQRSIPTGKEVNWIICHDATQDTRPAVFPGELFIWEDWHKGGIYGTSQRNHILGLLEDPLALDTWLLFLDDDTVLHPEFMRGLRELMSAHPDKKGFIFAQDIGGGRVRTVHAGNVKRNWIDMGQFVINIELVCGERFEQKYEADGIFIEHIYERAAERFTITNRVMSYYNFLRRETN